MCGGKGVVLEILPNSTQLAICSVTDSMMRLLDCGSGFSRNAHNSSMRKQCHSPANMYHNHKNTDNQTENQEKRRVAKTANGLSFS